MKIIFFGSSQFAVLPLEALISSGYEIACVVTQPDRKRGRHLDLAHTAVKDVALKNKLKVFQPENINLPGSIKTLRDFNAGLFVVIAYGQILSQEVLNIPSELALNIHASILPRFRGAAPINWALIKGEKNTGVTAMKMVKAMDAGPVLINKKIEIQDSDNAITLEKKLSLLAAEVLLVSLGLIENKKYKLSLQDKNKVTFAPKLKKENGLIHWDQPALKINNLIRGVLPWPGAYTYFKGKVIKVHLVSVHDGPLNNQTGVEPGEITAIKKEGIITATGEGGLIIKELQLEGKRKMSAAEFVHGHKISVGEVLGKKNIA